MSYILYGDKGSGAFSAEAVLAEAGAPYEFKLISLDKNEQREPAFLAINPSGKMPALRLPEGQIVTDKGYVVAPGIAVPATATAISVNAQGQVQASVPGQTAPQTVGQLELTRFPNEGGLSMVGDNLLTETPASGSPQSAVPGSPGFGTIQQGFLEGANVNAVEEMTSLITAQRAYEMNSKVITAADQMLQETSQLGQ